LFLISGWDRVVILHDKEVGFSSVLSVVKYQKKREVFKRCKSRGESIGNLCA